MTRHLPFAFTCLASLALLAAACGGSVAEVTDQPAADAGSTQDSGGGGDHDAASPSDAGSDVTVSSDAGGVLVPSDATITFTSKGGFAGQGNDTTTCIVDDETYTFEIPTGHLTWKVCEFTNDEPSNHFSTGERDIAPANAAALRAALDALRISTKLQAGADKPEEQLVVTTPSALTPWTYYDEFYHFQNDGKTYVSGLDDVLAELQKLAVHATK